jgi:hypothetical protein
MVSFNYSTLSECRTQAFIGARHVRLSSWVTQVNRLNTPVSVALLWFHDTLKVVQQVLSMVVSAVRSALETVKA